jgi:hypothetical protein
MLGGGGKGSSLLLIQINFSKIAYFVFISGIVNTQISILGPFFYKLI